MRGEDYDFQFSGRVKEGRLHFRLNMEYVGDDSQGEEEEPHSEEAPHHRYHLHICICPIALSARGCTSWQWQPLSCIAGFTCHACLGGHAMTALSSIGCQDANKGRVGLQSKTKERLV